MLYDLQRGFVSSPSPIFGASSLPFQHTRDGDIVFPDGNCLKEVKRGLSLRLKNRRNFPPTNLKMAALCHSTSSCLFLAETQNNTKPPFIWQTNKGLERSWEAGAREKLKRLERKEFSFTEPLAVVGGL